MRIDQEILEILDKDTVITDNLLKLTCGQLDRKIYLKVNKVLEAIGGKWDRKFQGHVFQEDPVDVLDRVLLTGVVEIPKEFGFYPTPPNIVDQMIEYAEIEDGMEILEPSAGIGNITDKLKELACDLTVIEKSPKRIEILKKKGYDVLEMDFLEHNNKYDRIIMNPPFEKQQDIDHTNHAFELLNEDGILVGIMASGVKFRENNKTKAFRKLVDEYGEILDLPENSFKESGTSVSSVMVVLRK